MPVLRFPDAEDFTQGLAEARHAIVRRAVDHTVLETIAVLATIFVSMGFVMYWGIVKQGSCRWRKNIARRLGLHGSSALFVVAWRSCIGLGVGN
ncbi:hypothetical protein B0T16DRAFT_420597 [Cercophora newfieldiana]|uniref:Uncharacterized protein n=1 Tax=Cercophora newfieldiana TaxID=92897 RepID=A0AA39XX21_9PEZI|nr:hypothetical protein B0T16DRAFT_420597 [Cercophora newfieldiana]